jgi:cytochrome c peroxidase
MIMKTVGLSFIFIFITGLIGISFIDNEPPHFSKKKLGELLFNEKMLSKDSTVSCASCHRPAYAFADSTAFSTGINQHLTKRNTPSVLNMKSRPYYFWDGRASSLNEQALMPIQNADEMGLPIPEALERLRASPFYNNYFRKVYKQEPNAENLAQAFAAYENTLETEESKLDLWGDNKIKLTAAEERGREIFVGDKSKCFNCHLFEDFTNDEFKNIGLFNGKDLNDSGRYAITKNKSDIGKFKTPGLRNVAITAPYMHNGMFATLEEVVDYYNDPRKKIPNAIDIDTSLQKPLGLTNQEKKDLVAFLKTLTDKRFEKNQ